ncbi:MAG: bifunctional 5,10-methylenetetrahydrofolate dehydrogenase/5,10-methenyltetrahydrofolate cyclohydrolase [Acidobacteria bacterium]|nr:bifunctional 5,10-methylenetetrahydrofolate dehydrogenase/5,10-methenyltetrahydrofolate cyclohydrolase [Acidobacteriota bacterium]
MTAQILDGTRISGEIREKIGEEVAALKAEHGFVPGLTVIQVGEVPESSAYVKMKEKAANKAGFLSRKINLPVDASEAELLDEIHRQNEHPDIDGILVQLPVPDEFDENKILSAVAIEKDVDGFNPYSVGMLSASKDRFIAPATPVGIMELIRRTGIDMKGKEAVVLGRSNIVGKPTAALLLKEHATVTICHSRTKDLPSVTSRADILVVAVGRELMVTSEYIKEGAVVIDVGVNYTEDEKKFKEVYLDFPDFIEKLEKKGYGYFGDVHYPQALKKASWITPVPGGVGPMTIASLLMNTVTLARRRRLGE